MKVVNEQVAHHQFGDGTIVQQTSTVVTVRFCEEYGEKKFLYPSAFESFLTLCNPACQESILVEMKQVRDQLEVERKKEEAAVKKQEEEQKAPLKQKRTAAKRRTPPKSPQTSNI